MNKQMTKFCETKKKDPNHYTQINLSDLETPITVLLGPNGTGKSMSMRLMQDECKMHNIKYASYSTSRDDIVEKSASPFGNWDVYGIACAFHSEGERMVDSFYKWANETMLRVLLEDKECPVYIFIDEADSGLSLDRIIQTIRPLVNIIKLDSKHRDIHVVFTCNSFEMYQVLTSDITTFLWVPTKEQIHIDSYEDFAYRYLEYCEEMHVEEE